MWVRSHDAAAGAAGARQNAAAEAARTQQLSSSWSWSPAGLQHLSLHYAVLSCICARQYGHKMEQCSL